MTIVSAPDKKRKPVTLDRYEYQFFPDTIKALDTIWSRSTEFVKPPYVTFAKRIDGFNDVLTIPTTSDNYRWAFGIRVDREDLDAVVLFPARPGDIGYRSPKQIGFFGTSISTEYEMNILGIEIYTELLNLEKGH